MAIDVEAAVAERYSQAAERTEAALCCPTSYNPRHLDAIPDEILHVDYGCGDPTAYVNRGEAVLDLGSGSGKICYILAQVVGREGRVIGVDMNDKMLALARKCRPAVAARLGYDNVTFYKAQIQNLRRDLDAVDGYLAEHPVRNSAELVELDTWARQRDRERPLIPDETIDCIVSNCVLNLVRPQDKQLLFAEMYRVLRNGGRAVISDIVCDEDVPADMQHDPELWSGCISGAYREELFLQAFLDAGFHGVEILQWGDTPWRVVNGIEFRSVTVAARKGREGPCWERKQAVIYKGPWSAVEDDDHHRYVRGRRTAVCDKTFNLLRSGSYARDLIFLEPTNPTALADTQPFDCTRTAPRHPRELKEVGYQATNGDGNTCRSVDGGCC